MFRKLFQSNFVHVKSFMRNRKQKRLFSNTQEPTNPPDVKLELLEMIAEDIKLIRNIVLISQIPLYLVLSKKSK
jgi:hypothetical protein